MKQAYQEDNLTKYAKYIFRIVPNCLNSIKSKKIQVAVKMKMMLKARLKLNKKIKESLEVKAKVNKIAGKIAKTILLLLWQLINRKQKS
jgi:hypothetical protein